MNFTTGILTLNSHSHLIHSLSPPRRFSSLTLPLPPLLNVPYDNITYRTCTKLQTFTEGKLKS